MNPTGQGINAAILEAGCFALTNLAGNYMWFYPRGKMPAYLHTYLELSEDRKGLLRDFLHKLPNYYPRT